MNSRPEPGPNAKTFGGSPGDRGHVAPLDVAAAVLAEAEYVELLSSLDRSPEHDLRICIHESGHAIAARLLGQPLGGMTANPDQNGKHGGLVWGPDYKAAFQDDSADNVPELCGQLCNLMPKDGESRADVADIFLHISTRCIELAAAAVAERMLLAGEPVTSTGDVEQAVGLASLICKTETAVERFLAFCEQQARDLLDPHWPIVTALSTELRNRRTLTGDEIDAVIADTIAQLQQAAERDRREQWRRTVESAAKFSAIIEEPHR